MTDEQSMASAAELLALGQGEKVVQLKTCGLKVKIKKATVGELSDIMNAAKDNAMEQFTWLVFRCMIDPKMSITDVKKLPHDVLLEVGGEIAKYSGLDKASVDRMQNLLGIGPVEQSS
jgi:hypothetical protein